MLNGIATGPWHGPVPVRPRAAWQKGRGCSPDGKMERDRWREAVAEKSAHGTHVRSLGYDALRPDGGVEARVLCQGRRMWPQASSNPPTPRSGVWRDLGSVGKES